MRKRWRQVAAVPQQRVAGEGPNRRRIASPGGREGRRREAEARRDEGGAAPGLGSEEVPPAGSGGAAGTVGRQNWGAIGGRSGDWSPGLGQNREMRVVRHRDWGHDGRRRKADARQDEDGAAPGLGTRVGTLERRGEAAPQKEYSDSGARIGGATGGRSGDWAPRFGPRGDGNCGGAATTGLGEGRRAVRDAGKGPGEAGFGDISISGAITELYNQTKKSN